MGCGWAEMEKVGRRRWVVGEEFGPMGVFPFSEFGNWNLSRNFGKAFEEYLEMKYFGVC